MNQLTHMTKWALAHRLHSLMSSDSDEPRHDTLSRIIGGVGGADMGGVGGMAMGAAGGAAQGANLYQQMMTANPRLLDDGKQSARAMDAVATMLAKRMPKYMLAGGAAGAIAGGFGGQSLGHKMNAWWQGKPS